MKSQLVKHFVAVISTLVCIGIMDFGIGAIFDGMIQNLPDDGERVAKSNYVLTKNESDIVVIGSSRAECHYDTRIIQERYPDKTVYNCGIDGQGLFYQIAVVNCLLDRYKPDMIIWDLQFDDLESSRVGNLSLLYPYYYKNNNIKEFLDKDNTSLKYYIWLNSYRFNGTAGRILKAKFFSSADQARLGFGGREGEGLYSVSAKTIDIKKTTLNKGRLEYFLRVVKRVKAAGVKLIVVESPLYDTHIGMGSTIEKLHELENEGMLIFIDDSQLPELLGKSEYMLDDNHMNIAGAKVFTEILCNQLPDIE